MDDRVGGWGVLPEKVVRLLAKMGIISNPLTEEDIDFLVRYARTWLNRDLLRAQLSRLNRGEKATFLETNSLPSQWERWAYSRIKNDRPILGKSPRNTQLIAEIRQRFTLDKNFTDDFLKGRLRTIRKMVTNASYWERRREKEREE